MSALTKYDKFVMLVNIFCISHAGRNWPSFTEDLGGMGILATAMRIPEDVIPDDYYHAANEFCEHVTHLRYANMRKPDWLPFGLIDYRRWRNRAEWAALGYIE